MFGFSLFAKRRASKERLNVLAKEKTMTTFTQAPDYHKGRGLPVLSANPTVEEAFGVLCELHRRLSWAVDRGWMLGGLGFLKQKIQRARDAVQRGE